jgi:hypothetical protein
MRQGSAIDIGDCPTVGRGRVQPTAAPDPSERYLEISEANSAGKLARHAVSE